MKDHFSAITEYAAAYAALERLQRQEGALLPIGDQKTRVIAEFYARGGMQRNILPAPPSSTGTPSEHALDITVRRPGHPDHLIQVKAVSAHSETSRVSPIHPGWDELYLMRLDRHLWPIGFWDLSANVVTWSCARLSNATMPRSSGSGSAAFEGAQDQLAALLKVLNDERPVA